MNRILKYIILSFTLTIICSSYAFSAEVKYDTSRVVTLLPDEQKIKDFRDKKDFNYITEEVQSDSFIGRLMDWAGRMIDKFFSNNGLALFFRFSIFAVLVVLIVFILMKVKVQSLFYKNRQQNSLFIEANELELLKSDLDELINKEIQIKNYRLAVRYLYLKLLKILNDKEIINMQINKTNNDYKNEMNQTNYKTSFLNLSEIFEFVFYGNFSVEKNVFDKVNNDFNTLFAQLNE